MSPLFLTLLPILAPQQPAMAPTGLPLPTLRPSPFYLQDLQEGQEVIESEQLWHVARPHAALLGSGDFDYARARQERADALAELNGWSSDERDSWLAATAPRPVGLVFEVYQGGQLVAASEQPVLPGSPVTLGRASATEMVHDFQVEIAQTSSVADPEMRPSFRGMQAGLVVLPVADRGWWVELAFASATHDPSDAEIDMGSESLAGKRRDARQIVEFSGALLVIPSEPTEVRLPGGMLLRLTLADGPGPGRQAAGRAIRVDVPTLSLDPGMQGMLASFENAVVWADPSGLLLLDADIGARVADELLRAAAAAPSLSIGLRTAQGGAEEEWLLGLRGVSGCDYHFAAGKALDVLVDWDVEVASAARIADPAFHRLLSGWSGTVGADLMMGDVSESRCDVQRTTIRACQGQELVLAAPLPGSGDGVGLPGLRCRIDQFEREVQPFRFRGALATCLLRSLQGDGTSRSLELMIRAAGQ